MSQPLPPPAPTAAPRGFAATAGAVALGAIGGVVALIVVAIALAASGGRSTAQWIGYALVGLGIWLAVMAHNLWKRSG